MFYFLSKLLDVFLSPYSWVFLFVALTIPWRRPRRFLRRRQWRRRQVVGIAGLTILYVFGLHPVSNGLYRYNERLTTSTYRPDIDYDAVVLLGGLTDETVAFETGQPAYNDNVERLIATHRLLADNRARFAIVSGAAVEEKLAEYGEARVLVRQMEAWGIDPERLIIEDQARNTYENAMYSKRIADERGFRRVVIVTSAYHMRRAEECFAAVDMRVDTLMVDFRSHDPSRFTWGERLIPRAGALAGSSGIIREMFGLYIYRLRGYAKPVPPQTPPLSASLDSRSPVAH